MGTRPDNLTEAVATIATELERAVEDPASPQELDRSRENLKGRVALSLESTTARMNRLGSALLGELPIHSVDEIVDRIDAVTVEDLRELTRELFAPWAARSPPYALEEDAAFLHALAPRCKRSRHDRTRQSPSPRHRSAAVVIRVAVAGAAGRMGATVCTAVQGAPDMELVGRADPLLDAGADRRLLRTPRSSSIFTRPRHGVAENALACRGGVHVVDRRTTGFDVEAPRGAARTPEACRGRTC